MKWSSSCTLKCISVFLITLLLVGGYFCWQEQKTSFSRPFYQYRSADGLSDGPSYHVDVYMDGKVIYQGFSKVAKIGNVKARIPRKSVEKLIDHIYEKNYLTYGLTDEAKRMMGTDYRFSSTLVSFNGKENLLENFDIPTFILVDAKLEDYIKPVE